MTTRQRLEALEKWAEERLCRGREYKSPYPDGDITRVKLTEPKVYLGWFPGRGPRTEDWEEAPNEAPGILIAPGTTCGQKVEVRRFDENSRVRRPPELGQTVQISMMFCIYEPGVRKAGFEEMAEAEELDISRIDDGTREGLLTLTDWLDEAARQLLDTRCIPGSDLILQEETLTYGLYQDVGYIVDRRPFYYGFLNATFNAYAGEEPDAGVAELLL